MSSAVEQGFLQQILTHPEEDGPRLIFADWLEENGNPRGEFIRVQCALARISPEDPQAADLAAHEEALLTRHESEWVAPLRRYLSGWTFHRGFIDCITTEVPKFLEGGPRIFQSTPLRRVRFQADMLGMAQLVESPLLGRVREIDLCGCYLGNSGPNLLSRSRWLNRLEVLDLAFNELTDRGALTLGGIASLANLRRLHVNDNPGLGASGVRAIADSPYLKSLRFLDLSGNELPAETIRILLTGMIATRLEGFAFPGNRLGSEGLEDLAESELFTRMLRLNPTLDLRNNFITGEGMRALAVSDAVENLEVLDLGANSIGDEGLIWLASSSRLKKLRDLRLNSNRITPDGIQFLASSPLMSTLVRLDLRENIVTEENLDDLRIASTAHDWRTPLIVQTSEVLTRRPLPPGFR